MNNVISKSSAILLRIYLGESDKIGRKQLYHYLVQYLKDHHFAGITVLRGIVGFGHKKEMHTVNILDLSTDLPIVIEVIDIETKIAELKQIFNELDKHRKINNMLITEQQIIRYSNQCWNSIPAR